MATTFCALCGKGLPRGKLKFIVRINIISDIDGRSLCSDDDSHQELYDLMEESGEPGGYLEEDTVSQELSLYLCVHCKKRFARDIIENEKEEMQKRKKNLGIVYH